MSIKIGIMAEEQNDVDVIYELTCKLTEKNKFSFCRFIGHGCGKLRRKCRAWAENLIRRGCSHIVIVHDLDYNDENELRKSIEKSLKHLKCQTYLILIPIIEIEALKLLYYSGHRVKHKS